MTPLEEVLAGREERAAWQRRWLSIKNAKGRSAYFICQIGLNIPGFPKRAPNDYDVINMCKKLLVTHANAKTREERFLENGAGVCWQGAFDAATQSASNLKRIAIDAENRMTAGRILDIDIITEEGPVSRKDMGLAERRCLLCGENAKVCARLGSHSLEELHELAIREINRAAAEIRNIK
ncbi:MAG: citrate lyase holo-[acyl-carrier protein] synthase [Cloacibacillus sp.]